MMQMRNTLVCMGLLGFALLVGCTQRVTVDATQQLERYSTEPYARVLAVGVKGEAGLVDYNAIAEQAEQDLDVYLDAIGRLGPDTVPEQFPSDAHKLAYYLNAYNAIMLKKWLNEGAAQADGNESVGWLTWFFQGWALNGTSRSMDTIEQDIIRPRFREPRIHFALVCGAMDCPPLLNEPFEAATLDAQLESLGRRWFTQPDALRVEEDGTVVMTPLLSGGWYLKDFKAWGGKAGVIRRFVPEDSPLYAPALEAAEAGNIKHRSYDWTINDVANLKP